MKSLLPKIGIVLASLLGAFVLVTAAVGQQPDPQPGAPRVRNTMADHLATKGHPTLPIGASAPDFSLPGIDGKMHKLREYSSSPVLMIVFTCVHCPTAQLYETRVQRLYDDYRNRGVAMVAINPNDPLAASPSELAYTDVPDTLEGMMIRAKYRHITYPYLSDAETQSVAQAYGPVATPHVFIFDKDRKLQFEGRIDDNHNEARVKVQDTRNALEAILAGKPIPVTHTAVFGCTTKWKEEIVQKQSQLQKIMATPVTLETATADDLKKLRTNPTGKMLLVNFWATWCGPCVDELPAMLETSYWFRPRGFEMVTVSANDPQEKGAVLKKLQELHAASRNLIFESDDVYAMMAAFDKDWQGGVPFSMVINPDGRVVYQQQGETDIIELRRAVLANFASDDGYPGFVQYWALKPLQPLP
jgi:peroxiredoxin